MRLFEAHLIKSIISQTSLTCYSVIPAALNVERDEIHSWSVWGFLRKQAPCHLLREKLVKGLATFQSQATGDTVHASTTGVKKCSGSEKSLKGTKWTY